MSTDLSAAAWEGVLNLVSPVPSPYATPGELAKDLDPRTIQTPALDLIDNALVDVADGRCDRLMISLAPQEGKGLALDTPIATPSGWTPMGDLRIGDQVFGSDGRPCTVTAAYEPRLLDCWRISFANGSDIVADGDHLWRVQDRNGRERGSRSTKRRPWVVVNSRALAANPARYGVPLPGPLELPDLNLPLDPYVLGVWLGGNTVGARITVGDEEIVEHIRAAGWPCRKDTSKYGWSLAPALREGRGPSPFRQVLTSLGVWGAKHVPIMYLRSSEKQRLCLLQGLMDTDGSVYANESGYSRCEFTTTDQRLAADVLTLTRSLGIHSRVHESRATLYGRDISARWRVRFTTSLPVFRLLRKAARLFGSPGERKPRYRNGVMSVESVAPVLTRCIEVDSPDRTFLAGPGLIPTHNSQRTSRRFPLWSLLRNPELRIAIVSYGDRVARRWGRIIRDDITAHPELGLAVNPNSSAANEWELLGHEGGVYCVGVRGALTSRPVDLLVIDDPYKDGEQADSEAWQETVQEFWTEVAIPRLGPGVAAVLIQTRWRFNDLSGWLQERDGSSWRVLNIPAQADHRPERGETDPLGRVPGEFMVSARGRTVEQWERRKREMGTRAWSALCQGKPSPGEGLIFHREWWKYYEQPQWTVDDTGAHHALAFDEVIQSWDMAFKDTDGADFVVGQVWGRRGETVLLLDQVRGRMSFVDTCQKVRSLSAKWPQAHAKLVEDKANGTAVINQLRNTVPGLIPVEPQGSKVARASAVSPFVEAGNVWLPAVELCPWVDGFVEECVIGSTMILTRLGLKRADEIAVGDEVLTHLGRFRPVTATSTREAAEVIEITAKTLDTIALTADHPVFAMSVRPNRGNNNAPTGKGWVRAGNLATRTTRLTSRGQIEPTGQPHHAMTFPVLDPEWELREIDLRAWFDVPERSPGRRSYAAVDNGTTIRMNISRASAVRYAQPLDHQFGRICGLYLAEGSYSLGRAFWSFHREEVALIAEVQDFLAQRLGCGSYVNRSFAPNAVNVAVSLPRFGRFFAEFGNGASEKRIPPWAWEAPLEFVEGLIAGWLDGDGHKTGNGWVGTTVSAHLAWGIRTLGTRVGRWVLLNRADPRAPSTIQGRRATPRHPRYTVLLLDREKATHVFDGEHIGLWVKDIGRRGLATVYNFTVNEDESYVTTGGAVHNCAAFPLSSHDDQVDAGSQALNRLLVSTVRPRVRFM